ncbi:substrate-binding domain-containing protein [Streptomyces fuscichromogenes]|uniref:Sugar ABC transporter n=1 Tax=Streptomyces fuscichromogenes TaxID=1324013 RepID=A0A917XLX4_9ACTN|nr:substrate-binding domain-containing protein [Streptomyces fuscichromogenes]GGN38966.1 sugar ABC transporter [Streptomyces fuscichromogenes]
MNFSTSHLLSRRGRRTRAAAIGVTVCLGATLAACGSSNGSSSSSASGGGGKVGVSLILKTLTNPYFVSMEKDAKAQAAKDNVGLTVAAGTTDGDTQTQITAIDNAISRGDKGILITTNGDAVNAALGRAKQAGLFVIALDTAPNPASTADITYATDNEQAGKLIGQYAAAALDGKPAVIAMLDLFNNQVVSVDINRDHGFLEGMGIDPGSKTENGKEAKSGKYTGGKGGTYKVVCHQPTQGAIDGGRTAMENCLSANPDINVVYAINEPAGEGAYKALKAAGKEKQAAVYAIDGSCSGLKNVTSGEFAADAVQYPGKMAALGVSSIAKLARGGSKPSVTNGKSFYDTGTALVAAKALDGLTVQSPSQAASACWGS